MTNLKMAVSHLLDWVGDGRRLSDADKHQKKLIRFAERQGFVTLHPIRGDFIVNVTGRRP